MVVVMVVVKVMVVVVVVVMVVVMVVMMLLLVVVLLMLARGDHYHPRNRPYLSPSGFTPRVSNPPETRPRSGHGSWETS